jgi:hypothetical protein
MVGCSGWMSMPEVPFVFGETRDGRWVGVNKELKLVLKIFGEEDWFLQECEVYEVLSANKCGYVPEFYGSFRNEILGMCAILISYEGPEIDENVTDTERQEDSFFWLLFFCLKRNGVQGAC